MEFQFEYIIYIINYPYTYLYVKKLIQKICICTVVGGMHYQGKLEGHLPCQGTCFSPGRLLVGCVTSCGRPISDTYRGIPFTGSFTEFWVAPLPIHGGGADAVNFQWFTAPSNSLLSGIAGLGNGFSGGNGLNINSNKISSPALSIVTQQILMYLSRLDQNLLLFSEGIFAASDKNSEEAYLLPLAMSSEKLILEAAEASESSEAASSPAAGTGSSSKSSTPPPSDSSTNLFSVPSYDQQTTGDESAAKKRKIDNNNNQYQQQQNQQQQQQQNLLNQQLGLQQRNENDPNYVSPEEHLAYRQKLSNSVIQYTDRTFPFLNLKDWVLFEMFPLKYNNKTHLQIKNAIYTLLVQRHCLKDVVYFILFICISIKVLLLLFK